MGGLIADLFKEAIQWCCQVYRMEEKKLYKSLLEENPYSHSRLRYSLARELTKIFHDHFPGTKAVFVYGSTVSDTAHLTSDIDLLILVDKENAPSPLFLEEINEHLCQRYISYLGLERKGLTSLLNVTFIHEAQRKCPRGPAALMNSSFHPPLRIPITG